MSHQKEKQQLLVIMLIVFMGFLGTSMAYPIFPPLFLYPTTNAIVPYSWSESARSIFLGLALAAYPFGQFIGSPILGGCSDRYGRKPVLILSLIGSTLGYLLSALSLQWHSLWLLLISRILTGIMEGNLAIVRAMVFDLKSINKYMSLGRVNSMAAIGYVMGPLLGGVLSDHHLVTWFSFAFPFYLAMLFSLLAVLLSVFKITVSLGYQSMQQLSIRERFNLIARFKKLFQQNTALKYLLIVSTIFTFSADVFYEFGPVYLTGLWQMSPSGIAVYNAILSLALALGAGWLPHLLANYFSVDRIIITAMLITCAIFGLLSLFPEQIFVFLLFGAIGLSIAVVNTNMTIKISNSADKTIQGEAMGTQLSLRMLGDAIICFVGGFLIISSVILPIVVSAVIALFAALQYQWKLTGDNP